MTLSCRAYALLMQLRPRPTDRDPIATSDFIGMLEAKEGKSEDLVAFQQWMAEQGVTRRSIPAGFATVCVPFLVGDCLPVRENKFCKHAHPTFAAGRIPLNHPLVLVGGERIRLLKGRVLVAAIKGFDLSKADKGLGGLVLAEERDEGFRPCIRGPGCSFRHSCIYHHPEEDKRTWGTGREDSRPCFRGAQCTYRERCKFQHSEEDKQAWRR